MVLSMGYMPNRYGENPRENENRGYLFEDACPR
jgi:hypothetical protein